MGSADAVLCACRCSRLVHINAVISRGTNNFKDFSFNDSRYRKGNLNLHMCVISVTHNIVRIDLLFQFCPYFVLFRDSIASH